MAVVVLLFLLVVPAAAQARAFGSRTLQPGSAGPEVRTLQRLLTKAGYETMVDGQFGPGTARSVKGWEAGADRRVNGRVSRSDARALRADAKAAGTSEPSVEPVADEVIEDEEAAEREANPGGASYVEIENATLNPDGSATAPEAAPQEVKDIIAAGNRIHDKPYRYGGGHGRFKDSGYDCSGSLSYALHGAGLLDSPLDSTGFQSWAAAGPGNWVTVYANPGHAYMVVAGLRFDTSGAKGRGGSRWTDEMRPSSGYVARHPARL